MPYISRKTRRNIAAFSLVLLISAVLDPLPLPSFPFMLCTGYIYCCLFIVWALLVRRRIVQRTVRRCLIAVSLLFLLLFLLRTVRFCLPSGLVPFVRWPWYGYYLPLTAVPLLVFMSALSIGRTDADRPLRRVKWLWLPCVLMILGVATNDVHGWAFYSDAPLTGESGYSHGWLYYVIVLWHAVLILAALFTMLRRCRLSQCRRLWWVPMLPVLLTVVLLLIYGYCGGAPTLFGCKLYNFQEVYCFGMIAFWECCVQIGLIPVNTDYGAVFDLSTVHAILTEADGRTVYHSQNSLPLTDSQRELAKNGAVPIGAHLYLRSAPVSGGTVYWTEDHTVIDEMNDDLQEAAERIEEENELIEAENRILAEKAHYETQNRLYDRIAYRTHDQLVKIDELLHADAGDEAVFRKNLAMSTILGAYVKRRGNLTILAAGKETLPLGEVSLSVQESMEYLGAYGVDCAVNTDCGEAALPASAALLCYDLFEVVTEAALPDVRAMLVNLSVRDGVRMSILLDLPTALPDPGWEQAQLAELGGTLSVQPVYDGMLVRLAFRKEGEQ